MYEPIFERLLIKDGLLKFLSGERKTYDEREQVVDEILTYREALISTMDFIVHNN